MPACRFSCVGYVWERRCGGRLEMLSRELVDRQGFYVLCASKASLSVCLTESYYLIASARIVKSTLISGLRREGSRAPILTTSPPGSSPVSQTPFCTAPVHPAFIVPTACFTRRSDHPSSASHSPGALPARAGRPLLRTCLPFTAIPLTSASAPLRPGNCFRSDCS
jgi:hypothetical protein